MDYGKKILIVDDNVINIEALEEELDGFHLATAESGEEALAIASKFYPDLILLDIMMPGMDGYEVCRKIRKNPEFSQVKIIMVSAKTLISDRLEGYEAGADDYITKPFDGNELEAKVNVYLRLKSVEEVDQLKTDLLKLLQHETNTPLNGIISPAQMLKQEENLDVSERNIWLDMICQSGLKLQSLFDNVITLTSMKQGTFSFEFVGVEFCSIIREAMVNLEPKASEKNLAITSELEERAIIELDGKQVTRAFMSILDNAIKYSEPGGRIKITASTNTGCFSLKVIDQGVGIDPQYLPYVFSPFSHQNLHNRTEGQGLSMSIAKHIVLAHNGTIHVESEKGEGTTFTIQLPLTSVSHSRLDDVR